jgi:hypothetical protein
VAPTSMPLLYKPDWPEAQTRWTAFWERAAVDRPCMDVKAVLPNDLPDVVAPEQPPEARWLDPDYIAQVVARFFETTWLGGESVPVGPHLMAGTTTGCGDNLHFETGGIGIRQCMSSIYEPVNWHPGPDDPWRPKIEKILNRLLDMSEGKFLVGNLGQYPVTDLLTMLRGNTEFMFDLADDCETCVKRLEETLPGWLANDDWMRGIIEARQDGLVSGWPGLWCRDYVRITQSDMSAMISDDLFQRFVMVELDALGAIHDRLWYHVCGCKRHLKALLSRPYIRTFQYSPGPREEDNGPQHIDFYREVQAAGRCLDISACFENMEYLIRNLRPEGLVLRTWAPSREAGEDLLNNATKLCGSHVAR